MSTLKEQTLTAFKWAENNLPGFSRNPQQVEYAALIASALDKGESARAVSGFSGQLLIEGETGTGKTLGYLVPSMLHAINTGSRVVISTYTLYLQTQIMAIGGDLVKANRIIFAVTGKKLMANRRIGRQHFVDEDRVAKLAEAYAKDNESVIALENLNAWMKGTCTGEIADWREETGLELPETLEIGDVCLNAESSLESSRFYKLHAGKGRDADIVLVTHAMLSIAGKCGWNLLHDIEDSRRIGALIVDEADRLPMVAQNITDGFLSLHSLKNRVIKAAQVVDFDATKLSKIGDDLWSSVTDAYQVGFEKDIVLWHELGLPKQESILNELKRFSKCGKPFVDGLRAIVDGKHEEEQRDAIKSMIAIYVDIDDIIEKLDDKSESGNAGVALRWSPKRDYPSIKTFDLYPARVLKKLWSAFVERPKIKEDTDDESAEDTAVENGPPVVLANAMVDCLILTSATLSTPGKERTTFWQSINDFGVYEPSNPCAGMHAMFTPRQYGSAQFVFPDPSVPAPFVKNDKDAADPNEEGDEASLAEINQEWLRYAATMVVEASKTGRTLVLTGSYRLTHELSALVGHHDVNLIEHQPGSKLSDMLPVFLEDSHAVLITPSGWEGLDLPHKIDNVVIAQLPFRPTDDVHSQALLRLLIKRGKPGVKAAAIVAINSLILAMRKFKQGFGRGIRAHNDKMTLWVADPRFPASTTFRYDLSGMVPRRGQARASTMFHSSIPARFRNGIGNPFDETSRMLLANGKLVEAEEILAEMV